MSSNPRSNSRIYIWLALFVFLFAIAPFLTHVRLWGINHLRFIGLSGTAVFILLAVFCCIPGVAEWIHRKINGIQLKYLDSVSTKRTIATLLIFFISAIVFYIFRNATYLLGDGFLRGDELGFGISYLPLSTEPLTAIVHYVFYKILSFFAVVSEHVSIQIFSSIAGAAFVIFAAKTFKPLKKNEISLILPILGFSGTQLFFGYVESYELLYIFMLIYIWTAFRFLRDSRYFATASILFALAFMSHFSAIFALPAHLVLIFAGFKNKQVGQKAKIVGAMAFLVMTAAFLYFRFVFEGAYESHRVNFLLPFIPDGYWLFSPAHLLDILNNFLLSSTVALILMPLIIKRKLWTNLQGNEKIFAAILSLGAIGFTFSMNPRLGFARDWDLYISASIVFCLISLYMIQKAKNLESIGGRFTRSALLLPMIFTAAFITVNSSRSASYERFEYILRFHSERSASGYEVLGGQYRQFYENSQDLQKALQSYKKAFQLIENPRYLVNIASVYDVMLNNEMGNIPRSALMDSIEHYSRQALALDDSLFAAYEYLAMANTYRGNYETAIGHTEKALEFIDPRIEPEFRFKRARLFLETQDWNSAIREFETIIDLNPKFSKAYVMLGNLYLQIGEKEKAKKYLTEFIRLEPNNPLTPRIKQMLITIGQ